MREGSDKKRLDAHAQRAAKAGEGYTPIRRTASVSRKVSRSKQLFRRNAYFKWAMNRVIERREDRKTRTCRFDQRSSAHTGATVVVRRNVGRFARPAFRATFSRERVFANVLATAMRTMATPGARLNGWLHTLPHRIAQTIERANEHATNKQNMK